MVNLNLLKLSATAAIGGFLFGYDTGVVNGALYQIADEFNFHTESFQSGLVVSITIGGAFFGSILSGALGDWAGRWYVMFSADIIFVISAAIMALAWEFWILCAGRLICGVSIGLAAAITPVYLSECAPPEKRGTIVASYNMMITFGQFVAAALAALIVWQDFSGDSGWRWMLGLAGVPPLLQAFLLMGMPESPRHMITQGKQEEAIRVLQGLEYSPDVRRDVKAMQDDMKLAGPVSVWPNRTQQRALFVGMGLMIFQQFDGINTIMYYSATILHSVGVSGNRTSVYISIAPAFINFAMTFPAVLYSDHRGRKLLLYVSSIGCAISMTFMAWGSHYLSRNEGSLTGQIVCITSLCLYIFFFAPGLGPVPWIMNSEIYATEYRAIGTGIATATNWAADFLVSQFFPVMLGWVGSSVTFLVLVVFCLLTIVFTRSFVPETKGLTLEQIQSEWNRRTRGYSSLQEPSFA